jgi:hypothetical protein
MGRDTRNPDIDDMLVAGMPLWAAFRLCNEIAARQAVPSGTWWKAMEAWTSPLQASRIRQ